MKLTSFEEFVALAQQGTFVPVCKEIMADLLTPVSAFLRIAEHSDYAFLLESVEGGEHVGRYSFLGKDPFLLLRGHHDRATIEEAGVTQVVPGPFVETLRRLMNQFQAPHVPGLPRLTGGAVGYFGYDTAQWFEPALPATPAADDPSEQAGFMLFDTVLAFDHVQHRILIIANARVTGNDDLRALYDFACTRIGFLQAELERALAVPRPSAHPPLAFSSNLTRERFEAEVDADAFTVYRALRHVNPSPYMFFIRMGGRAIVGSSPEMLVRVEGRQAVTHPIAGTRPRGATEQEDRRLAEELQASEKEKSEHVMLVDLGRNDIGRVSTYGSVEVARYMALERYSHVMHLVSVVNGTLADRCDRLDALMACFPAGTVSGAPKVRAMQIIAELEPDRRGLYAGAIGYLDFAGNLDCCIAIRTVVMEGRRARVQAGAGVVADSDPTAEYQETRDKARAMMRALELAQAGL